MYNSGIRISDITATSHHERYSRLHLEFHFSNLKLQSIILFCTSLLTRSVEERPVRMRFEMGLNDTPIAIGCTAYCIWSVIQSRISNLNR